MKKIIFGVFAHPDDEAFGPAGTFMKEIDAGAEVQLVSFTLGEAGCNPDNIADLADHREKEWRESCRLIGASKQHYLGYKDGQLNNDSMITAGEKIVKLVRSELASGDYNEVEFVTIDLGGVTGHIDHIVAARATCWAYYTLKKHDYRIKRVRLACLSRTEAPELNVDWIYMQPGYGAAEIDETVDARAYRERIVDVMHAHHSQRADCEQHLRSSSENIGLNYFRIVE